MRKKPLFADIYGGIILLDVFLKCCRTCPFTVCLYVRPVFVILLTIYFHLFKNVYIYIYYLFPLLVLKGIDHYILDIVCFFSQGAKANGSLVLSRESAKLKPSALVFPPGWYGCAWAQGQAPVFQPAGAGESLTALPSRQYLLLSPQDVANPNMCKTWAMDLAHESLG